MKKKELLYSIIKKDFNVEYFSGTGAGGQHRNKHQNCVRLRHNDSGVTTTGQSNRDRQTNLKEAFNSLVKHPKFKVWMNKKTWEVIEGKTIEQKVEESLIPKNLKVEIKEDGKWTLVDDKNCTL
jgi:protein subunit release factor B